MFVMVRQFTVRVFSSVFRSSAAADGQQWRLSVGMESVLAQVARGSQPTRGTIVIIRGLQQLFKWIFTRNLTLFTHFIFELLNVLIALFKSFKSDIGQFKHI